jgi:hypothetical protein
MILVSDIHIGVHEEHLLTALVAAAAADEDKVVAIAGSRKTRCKMSSSAAMRSCRSSWMQGAP